MKLKIALVQMRSEKGVVIENLSVHRHYIARAVKQGAELVCFPEMSISSYINPAKYPHAVRDMESSTVKELLAMSRKYGVTILAGILEENGTDKPYITQIVARDGELAGSYRKITVIDEEAEWYSAGKDIAVFEHKGLKFGISICADIESPQIFSEYARQGAKLVIECAAPGLYGAQSGRNWQSGFDWWRVECRAKLGKYAAENGIYIAVCTQAGRTIDEDFPGGGYVFSPQGSCILETPDWKEGILLWELEL